MDEPRNSQSADAEHARDEAPAAEAPPPPAAGLSLDEMNAAFARMLQSGEPPQGNPPAADDVQVAGGKETEDHPAAASRAGDEDDDDDPCEVSPRTILEAILFVGTPDNRPLAAREMAALMRGVDAQEIDQLVRELNERYETRRCPYRIAGEGAGYRLVLRDEMARLRDRFYGRVREARLSQAAVDVLAIVSYNQGIARDEVSRLRGKDSGAILAQLVRRGLLRVEREEQNRRILHYHTTERFLKLFGLETLEELPQSQELDR